MTVVDWDRFVAQTLEDLRQSALHRTMRAVEAVDGPRVKVNGRWMVQFASNDYLGLAQHPRLRAAAARALEEFGMGVGASRLVTGNTEPTEGLERDLARFKGVEASLVFASGYAANVGIISALAGKKDRILSDELNHASIVDGCRLSGAAVEVYPHGDTAVLRRLLAAPSPGGRTLVVTDGVFSMDGDPAPLPEIVPLCRKHHALLMIDDAHATGVLGETGRGSLEHFGVHDPSVLQVGTFSKALGGLGGFAAGTALLMDFLRNRARTLIYSTGLPFPVTASNREALAVLREEPWRRETVLTLAERLRRGLGEMGFPVLPGPGPIVPLIIGDPERALRFSRALYQAGILAPAIRPPSVPPGTSRIRLSVSALHREEDLGLLLEAVGRAAEGNRS